MEKWQWMILALFIAISAGFAEVFPSAEGNVTIYKYVMNLISERLKA